MLLDGIRDVQFIGMGSYRWDDSVRSMVLVFELLTQPFGASVPSVHPDKVVGLEGRCRGTLGVRVVLLSGLCIPHLAPGHLLDPVQAFGCGLDSVFLWVVDADIQLEVTMGVIAGIGEEGGQHGRVRYMVVSGKLGEE